MKWSVDFCKRNLTDGSLFRKCVWMVLAVAVFMVKRISLVKDFSLVNTKQGSTYLLEGPLWKIILSQSYVGQMRLKTCSPTIKFSQPIEHYISHSCQGSTYLFETLSWKDILSQPHFWWAILNISSPTDLPCPKDNIFLTVLKTNLLTETIVSQTQLTFICSNSAIITVV